MSATKQPVPWSSIPSADVSAAEILRSVSLLSINHGFSLQQALPGVPMRAKYGIFNDRGEQLFSAFEESDPFLCCARDRGFTMHVLDNNSRELIQVYRELQRCSGYCHCDCCESCMQHVTVESPPGQIIGTVRQERGAGDRNYTIKDVTNDSVLTIAGPRCVCDGIRSWGGGDKYILLGTDGSTEIGVIEKNYLGSTHPGSANPVAFTLSFPVDLDVRMKILALAALFLIDIAVYPILRGHD